ncbi:MAG: TetR/AcrR family transcriptional regulator [Pseudonocardia sp.]|nr:TetR/AcrR family transcriptional regulator [Pseudonocardia sp.]
MNAAPDPPWWTPRKTATARRSLTREAIVGAALTLLRTGGIDAVSMRRVAAELDTGAASLYAHVAHKDELLELVFDAVAGEIPVPEPDPDRWQEQILELWTASHAVLVRNRDLARVALGRVPVGPNSMRVAESTVAILRAGGVPEQAVAWAVDVVGLYVSASAIEGSINAEQQAGGRDTSAYYADVGRYFEALPADGFPVMAALAPFLMTGDGDERFRFGLQLLVNGLAALTGD